MGCQGFELKAQLIIEHVHDNIFNNDFTTCDISTDRIHLNMMLPETTTQHAEGGHDVCWTSKVNQLTFQVDGTPVETVV